MAGYSALATARLAARRARAGVARIVRSPRARRVVRAAALQTDTMGPSGLAAEQVHVQVVDLLPPSRLQLMIRR